MSIGEICSRIVVVAQRETSVQEGARRMRENHVGALVVIDNKENSRPIGVVTDRDMVIEVIAMGLEPKKLTVGDIMTEEVFTVNANDGVDETIRRMRGRGVRRLVVVDDTGRLAGVVTIDDVLELLAEELSGIAGAITGGVKREQELRR